MDALIIAAERARVRRRIVVLDRHGHIVLAQKGSAFEDSIFGFDSRSERLPLELAEAISDAMEDARSTDSRLANRFIPERNIGLRVFRLKHDDQSCVGVILELVRRRSTDRQ
jgi:hypothetical protein